MKVLLMVSLVFLAALSVPAPLSARDIQQLQAGVVKITAVPPRGQPRTGTGFIVRLEEDLAYIITSAHVVTGDVAPRVEFFTKRNVGVAAEVVNVEGSDPLRGLALLLVTGTVPKGVAALPLASGRQVSVGEEILVIGFPSGAGPWNITRGNIGSRQGRDLYFSPPVDEGNSGGPIIQNGKVVGLVAGGGLTIGQGVLSTSLQSYLDGFDVNPQARIPETVTALPSPLSRPPEPPAAQPAGEIVGNDGAPMVLVPAGEFWMGSPEAQGDDDERPRHRVYLNSFYIDKYETSVSRYAKFMQAAGRKAPTYWDQVKLEEHGNLPVVGVDWSDAEVYCRWAGKRLPAEAEWEKAARGTDGRTYPWGNEEPTSARANFGRDFLSVKNPYEERLAPVDSLEAGRSPYGVHHLAGNVWEWVADWYANDYYRHSLREIRRGLLTGNTASFAAGPGSMLPGACVRRSATGTVRRAPDRLYRVPVCPGRVTVMFVL
ncbi:hypothetical protein YTPLAS18_10050 [Nitrospira sp.]|nr:hypothetical protein YTPLAS18_10050 [Nitrospira sp.]